MTEITVNITAHMFGVQFTCVKDQKIKILRIKPNSDASKLGLLPGDILTSINNESVLQAPSSKVLIAFRHQSLPFTATFQRYEIVNDNYDLSPLPDHDDINLDFRISNSSTISHHQHIHNEITNGYIHSNANSASSELLEYNDSDKDDDMEIKETADVVIKDTLNDITLFDKRKQIKSQNISKVTTFCTCSDGFVSGKHEWSIKILKCDKNMQEIGVISNNDLSDIMIAEGGITETNDFGARAIYGNEIILGSNYYSSYNDNGHIRIFKELNNIKYWRTNDMIRVCLDLYKGTIRFYLNDKKVRKMISLQKNKTYYPFIAFVGDCQYQIIDYK